MFIYGREENARVGILVHIEDKDKNLLLTTFSTNKTPVPGSAHFFLHAQLAFI